MNKISFSQLILVLVFVATLTSPLPNVSLSVCLREANWAPPVTEIMSSGFLRSQYSLSNKIPMTEFIDSSLISFATLTYFIHFEFIYLGGFYKLRSIMSEFNLLWPDCHSCLEIESRPSLPSDGYSSSKSSRSYAYWPRSPHIVVLLAADGTRSLCHICIFKPRVQFFL